MANSSEEQWKSRLFNQRFPLIGEKEPGEGNGFHDRISFDVPYHLQSNENKTNYSSWLYSVYFRDLSNFLNPQYKNDRGEDFSNSIRIENCTENYKKTFLKYIGASNSWRNDGLLEVLGHWGQYLFYQGRIVMEFVHWYDNKTRDFYAFELKHLKTVYYTINDNSVLFSAPFENESNESKIVAVEIPREKCIIIEWPKELGGFSSYEETVKSILELGNKYEPILKSISNLPEDSLKNMKDWDLKFNKLTSKWGTTHPSENSTEFYKQFNYFILKGTMVYCTHALIDGLRQLITFLNRSLNEDATLSFENEESDIERFLEMKKKWLEGKLSFKESTEYLTFH